MSHSDAKGTQLAALVHEFAVEHMNACLKSNCTEKMFQNKAALDRGKAVEKLYSGDSRKYDACLKVQGGYHA